VFYIIYFDAMKITYSFIALLFSLALQAQHIERFYDWQWKLTEPNKARFILPM
jgi:hypothetical protein